MDVDRVMRHLQNHCEGKHECEIQLGLQSLYSNVPDAAGVCGTSAYFFVQMPCLFPPAELGPRLVSGLVISCVTVFLYMTTLVWIDYLKAYQVNQCIDWDVKTVTAGDYTIEFVIDRAMY